jgi:hypothetical protein
MAAPRERDVNALEQVGWGVIVAPNVDPGVRFALEPLIQLRREQAVKYFREFPASGGYQDGDSGGRFLSRQGVGQGQVAPERVPYYLLLVGSPNDIPFRFQQQLDVNYAVGRLHFDSLDAYHNYALNVVASERSSSLQVQQGIVFAPKILGDLHTTSMDHDLVMPLANELRGRTGDWTISLLSGEEATKNRLNDILGGLDPTAFLFAATHGVVLSGGDPHFNSTQGALVCQEWSGPATPLRSSTNTGLSRDAVFGAVDLMREGEGMRGAIALFWSSFSAGFGSLDARPNAPRNASIAALPQALLGERSIGVLAVMGFVDRLLGFSSPHLPAVDRYRDAVSRAIRMLMTGARAGVAAQSFDEAYAELSVALSSVHEKRRYGQEINPAELVGLWAATNDMRNVVLLGDPAVRLGAAVPAVR